jgi:hypothetical protein
MAARSCCLHVFPGFNTLDATIASELRDTLRLCP